jgi:serine/threonine protein kinase
MHSRPAPSPIDAHAPTIDAAGPTLLSSGVGSDSGELPVCTAGCLYAGQYEVRSMLGQGGMAEVYLVEHRTLRAEFALKVLRRSYRAQPEIVERFRVEARALWELGHPGFVRVHHAGDDPELGPFLVLERLRGRSLRDVLIATGRLEPGQAVPIVVEIAEAAAAMHERGMIHRDLKPENVFLSVGAEGKRSVKLLDLGAAKIAKYGAIETAANHTIGTLRYMSPEQLRAEAVAPTTDVYALGHILYELLSGRHAFGDRAELPTSPLDVVRWHSETSVAPLDELVPSVRPELARVVVRALRTDPAARPSSMSEFASELRAALASPAESTARDGLGLDTHVRATSAASTTSVDPRSRSDRWLTPRGTVRLDLASLGQPAPAGMPSAPSTVVPLADRPTEPARNVAGARSSSALVIVVASVVALALLVAMAWQLR